MIEKFNHVGIAVKDLEKAVGFFQDALRARLVWRAKFENDGIESACVAVGEACFELTASLNPGSLIDKFIEARGEGITTSLSRLTASMR